MVKITSTYVCQQCGFKSTSYLGRCPRCGSWNSLVETVEETTSKFKVQSSKPKIGAVVNLKDVEKDKFHRTSTQIDEFDRVLGGGLVAGSLVLLAGDPGIGKSTLLTQISLNHPGCLYVAGEESAHQIKIRAQRLNPRADFKVLNETDISVIINTIYSQNPGLVIVDSIQTIETEELSGIAGSVGQVRECAHRLQKLAKQTHIPIILVGHVTKEGTVAGPKTLEHMVDVVLYLEGDPSNQFRVLRGAKNRFGATDEVGVFEMTDQGMGEVKNPSRLFLEQRVNAPGSAVVSVLTGLRPILVEVQALVTKTSLAIPRRTGSGVDNNRLQLLVAVLQKRLGLPLYATDIFVNVTGGLRVVEPAADLAICMAIISSFKDKPLNPKSVFIGEVGLLGELRSVRYLEKRVSEAKKLGFTNIVSFEKVKTLTESVKVIPPSG